MEYIGAAGAGNARPVSSRRVCAVYANRTTGQFIGGDAKDAAEAACVETGLESLLVLAQMDEQQRAASTDRWRLSLWTSTVTQRYPLGGCVGREVPVTSEHTRGGARWLRPYR